MQKLIIGITAEGSVVLLEGQLKYFRDLGYETYLLGPDSQRVREYCEKEGCTLLKINVRREISVIHDFFILQRIIYIFFRIKPDIINLGTPKVSLLGMIAGKLLGVPKRIYTCRGFRFEPENGFKRKMLILMEKITVNCASKVICISSSLRDFGVKNGIFTAAKAKVINKGSSNGINLTRFSPQSVTKESIYRLKKELGIEEKFIFGFVGRIYDRKGINELCEAFSRLCQSLPDIVLLLVGRFEEAQIADKRIIEYIKSHSLIKHVGSQKNVPLYMSIMDVFVMPAWGEGFGNVMVEAAAMGIPVISTDATGTKDSVCQDFNGLLIEPKSVDKLAETMKLMYSNRDLREKMGRNGVEWARNFDNLIIWNGLKELYNVER